MINLRIIATSLLMTVCHFMAPAAYAAAQQATSPPWHTRPSNIPADYVATPFGVYVARDCLIFMKTNIVPSVSTCDRPRYNRDGTQVKQDQSLAEQTQGNSDLQVSFVNPDDWTQSMQVDQTLERSDTSQSYPATIPTNQSDQTIFFTSGLVGHDVGYVTFLAYNLVGYKNTWSTGVAIANVNGNVVLRVFFGRGRTGAQGAAIISASVSYRNDFAGPAPEFGAAMETGAGIEIGPFYYNHSGEDPSRLNVLSVITFGVTSCDMLPPVMPLSGMLRAQQYGKLLGAPHNFTNGLCGLKADVAYDSDVNRPGEFKYMLNYYNVTPAKSRSAVFTFTSK